MSYVTLWVLGAVESELLHTYSRVDTLDVLVLLVRVAVLVAVTLTVPVVLFPVRTFIGLVKIFMTRTALNNCFSIFCLHTVYIQYHTYNIIQFIIHIIFNVD